MRAASVMVLVIGLEPPTYLFVAAGAARPADAQPHSTLLIVSHPISTGPLHSSALLKTNVINSRLCMYLSCLFHKDNLLLKMHLDTSPRYR
jgi:hypothetical protein